MTVKSETRSQTPATVPARPQRLGLWKADATPAGELVALPALVTHCAAVRVGHSLQRLAGQVFNALAKNPHIQLFRRAAGLNMFAEPVGADTIIRAGGPTAAARASAATWNAVAKGRGGALTALSLWPNEIRPDDLARSRASVFGIRVIDAAELFGFPRVASGSHAVTAEGPLQIEEAHDVETLGPTRADESKEGKLLSLADLVRWLTTEQGIPAGAAVARLVVRIDAARADGLTLFRTVPDAFALPIGMDTEVASAWWAHDFDGPLCGPAGALELLRTWWLCASPGRERIANRLDVQPCARVAIRATDALRLFGLGSGGAVAVPASPWPHKRGPWSPVEMEELRRMDATETRTAIAAKVGVSKTRIDQLLGGTKHPKKGRAALQVAAMVLAGVKT